jgi:hypothetical protein
VLRATVCVSVRRICFTFKKLNIHVRKLSSTFKKLDIPISKLCFKFKIHCPTWMTKVISTSAGSYLHAQA